MRKGPSFKSGLTAIDAAGKWLARRRGGSRELGDVILVTTAIFLGATTAVAAILFIRLLAAMNNLALTLQASLGPVLGLLLAMGAAGLLVGFLIDRWAREAKGHGVPEVMEAVAMRGGRIRARVAAIKVLASSITIGAGGSAGREGPIVQTGAALGSTLGQLLHMNEERVRTLVGSGAAAGISATFNAPIAGSIFALEVILGRFTVRYFGIVVMSAVSASIVARRFLGDQPAFSVPAYALNHLGELPIYFVLGVLAALVAVLFIRVLYRAEALFDAWEIPLPIKAALGMLLTGLIALLLPGREVLGSGLHMIGEAIADGFAFSPWMMLALLLLKLLATTFTLGSGNSGGVFAPALFMGAVLGGLVGMVAHQLLPAVAVNPGAYAIVGMAAVFAGAARAPITAVLIVFEMSGDYKLILPLMMATVLATLLAESLFAESIYTLKLKIKGIRWQRGRDENVLHSVRVEEVMSTKMETLATGHTVGEAAERFAMTHHHGMPILDERQRLWGLMTITDLDRALEREIPSDRPVTTIATPRSRLVVTYPDETIGMALDRMGPRGFGRLPVVSRDDPDELLGVVGRSSIIQAYHVAVSRQQNAQQQMARARLHMQGDARFVEVVLDVHDGPVGRSVQEIIPHLPADCILVSLQRDGRTILPHGSTRFQAGDLITLFTHHEDADQLRDYIHHPFVES